jgi:hypothetical protein
MTLYINQLQRTLLQSMKNRRENRNHGNEEKGEEEEETLRG